MRRALVFGLTLLFALPAAPALAGHVTAAPEVSARLGERISDNSWAVIVDWSINCSGPAPGNANYFGNLNLDDLDSGEAMYMGGTVTAAGSNRQPVARQSTPRHVRPRIKASCGDGGPTPHGSDTFEVTGNTVTVPAKGDEDGDGVRDGGSGFGGPRSPLRSGGCAVARLGTRHADTLNGTAAADLAFGLEGNDVIRGRGDDDCLIGGPGKDRLFGGGGYDRLTGGSGADLLVGGPGVNRYDAGGGRDVVRARNGRAEMVSCGSGRDRARVDRSDRVRNCERVDRA